MRAALSVRALTAALVVAATATGCASARAAAADPPAAAAPAAPAHHVAHFTWDRLTPDNLVPTLARPMVEAGSLTWTTRTSDATGPIESVVDVDLTRSNTRVRLTLPEGEVEIRSVDGRRYVMSPVTEGQFVDVTTEDPGLVRLPVAVDPVRPVRALFGAVVDVHPAGRLVVVDGVMTQPYEVVVATAKLADSLGALGGGLTRDQLPPTVTLTYWVDQQNRLRRATSDVAGASVQTDLTNWGENFGIVAPTKAEIRTEPLDS
ncbi:hypothetical protein [Cellulomonas sp. URHB0016]